MTGAAVPRVANGLRCAARDRPSDSPEDQWRAPAVERSFNLVFRAVSLKCKLLIQGESVPRHCEVGGMPRGEINREGGSDGGKLSLGGGRSGVA